MSELSLFILVFSIWLESVWININNSWWNPVTTIIKCEVRIVSDIYWSLKYRVYERKRCAEMTLQFSRDIYINSIYTKSTWTGCLYEVKSTLLFFKQDYLCKVIQVAYKLKMHRNVETFVQFALETRSDLHESVSFVPVWTAFYIERSDWGLCAEETDLRGVC